MSIVINECPRGCKREKTFSCLWKQKCIKEELKIERSNKSNKSEGKQMDGKGGQLLITNYD